MKKSLTIFVIALIIILFILPIASDLIYLSCNKYKDKKLDYRTGDILLYKCGDQSVFSRDRINCIKINATNIFNLSGGRLFNNLISGYYTHIAIIIVIDNCPYIYDAPWSTDSYSIDIYDNLTRTVGLVRRPVLLNISYINKYVGDVYRIKYIGKHIPIDVIVNTINKNKNIKINTHKCIAKCILNDNIPTPNSLSCVSLTISVCINFGILSLKNYNCISPTGLSKILLESDLYDDIIYKL